VGHTLWLEQLKAMGVTVVLAIAGTVVIGAVVRLTIGFRPPVEAEEDGLDQLDHGEAGYHLDEGLGHTVGGGASHDHGAAAMALMDGNHS
jgi:ammonia channel protein AmtB